MSGRSYAGRLARLEALEVQRREREEGGLADRLNRALEAGRAKRARRAAMGEQERLVFDIAEARADVQRLEDHMGGLLSGRIVPREHTPERWRRFIEQRLESARRKLAELLTSTEGASRV